MIALVFSYEVRETGEFERVYGPDGDWAQFFSGAAGYIGTELLRDVELPSRYLVIDRWESAEAYNTFAAAQPRGVHAAGGRQPLPLRAGASLRHLRERVADKHVIHAASRSRVLGLWQRPRRDPSPSARSRRPQGVRGLVLVRRAPPGGAGARARRPRRSRPRRGVRPPRDVVPVPRRHRADLRALSRACVRSTPSSSCARSSSRSADGGCTWTAR